MLEKTEVVRVFCGRCDYLAYVSKKVASKITSCRACGYGSKGTGAWGGGDEES